ncbi:phage pre-tape measure protein [Mesorhizobium opportunistum]|uniref:Uncharacterized protein n=1 Tax=Mesorhizobium opportunistum (strain LMG 24607 / HAMBI 3007 / WSM2075) TaxID=536019 RepID=F7XZY3_MESOW|nr:hypothetical protein [Mesorhizobium opportunistum]AEH88197.1 hypothetical protein Mesop_3756 [Mesorhizobium opportunistum WSM2075]
MSDDLLDLAPAAEVVPIRGKKLSVSGISSKGIIALLRRFPAMSDIFTGESSASNVEKLAGLVVAIGGDLVGAIIAAGLGYPGDEKREKVAADLVAGEQFDLVEAIVRVTFPNGLAPLVEKVRAMRGDAAINPTLAKMPPVQPIKLRKRSSTSPERTSAQSTN